MTREEAIAIIHKEYLCVDRDCDIEKNCGKCDLVMPSKEPILEAYKMAIKALEQEPCEDAISRRAVLDVIEREEFKGDAISEIEKLSPATPQPKTGHWIPLFPSNDERDNQKCSRCGYENQGATRFCPDCGAIMFEAWESEE